MEKEEIIIKEILHWIIENLDDIENMDKISKIIFPYTTEGKKVEEANKQNEEFADSFM